MTWWWIRVVLWLVQAGGIVAAQFIALPVWAMLLVVGGITVLACGCQVALGHRSEEPPYLRAGTKARGFQVVALEASARRYAEGRCSLEEHEHYVSFVLSIRDG